MKINDIASKGKAFKTRFLLFMRRLPRAMRRNLRALGTDQARWIYSFAVTFIGWFLLGFTTLWLFGPLLLSVLVVYTALFVVVAYLFSMIAQAIAPNTPLYKTANEDVAKMDLGRVNLQDYFIGAKA